MRYVTAALLLVTLTLAGCGTVEHIPAETNVRGIDLTPLTEGGFLVTPGDYSGGEFEALGMVKVTVWPEAERLDRGEAEERGLEPGIQPHMWMTEKITMEEVLKKTRRAATGMGADAITHFEVRSVTRKPFPEEPLILEGIEVNGFAINRVGADMAGP